MTAPSIEPAASPDPRTAQRILIGAGGIVLLGVGVVVTLGTVFIGVGAIAIAWYLKHRRQLALTRGKAWFISVISTVVPLLLLLLVTTLSAPSRTPEQVRHDLATQRARRDAAPEWLRRFGKQPGATQAADSVAERLLQNRGFMVWFTAMAAMIGSTMLGLFSGTIAWGASMILFRAAKGDWMGTGRAQFGAASPG